MQNEAWFLLGCISEPFADIAQKTLKLADRRGDIRCSGAGATTWVLLCELEGTWWFDLGSPIDARDTYFRQAMAQQRRDPCLSSSFLTSLVFDGCNVIQRFLVFPSEPEGPPTEQRNHLVVDYLQNMFGRT
jgi:hypothetical protein